MIFTSESTRRRSLRGWLAVAAIGALAALPATASAAPEDFGLDFVEVTMSNTQAGDHPDLTMTFEVATDPNAPVNLWGLEEPYAATRSIRFDFPPGLTADPNALGPPQQCTVEGLANYHLPGGGCPNGSQIGITEIFAYDLSREFVEPVYMMTPPGGDIVGRVGFVAGLFPTFVDFRVRSESDYGLSATIGNASAEVRLVRAETSLWGVPADPSHDTERMTPLEAFGGARSSPPRPPGSRPFAFLTNPTRCGTPLDVAVHASSWVHPDVFDTATTAFPAITGCDRPPFGPSFKVEPTNHQAAAPTGLDLTIDLPAPEGTNVLETAQPRDIELTLPKGVSINPSAAHGLQACSAAQVGFGTNQNSNCPDAAKLGGAELAVPALPRRMVGSIYLRTPEPPDHLFRFWAVADDLGAHIKLPGELELDPNTGQVKATTLDLPQFPVRQARLLFKSGFRATLTNPPTCGEHVTAYTFRPWTGTPPVTGTSTMTIDEGCDTGGFSPNFSAGTMNPVAGGSSDFMIRITRDDGEQAVTGIQADLPPGLIGKLAGVSSCSDAILNSIPTTPGTGQAEQVNPSCPANSLIGRLEVGAGAGPTPFFTTGRIYLAGPYQGAPLSVAVVTPAVAGPLDFGNVVIRNKLMIDQDDAQVHFASDPIPTILDGVPLQIRDIRVVIDRAGFILNPTNCNPMKVTGTAGGAGADLNDPSDDTQASFSDRFQVSGCGALGFKPKLSLRLRGGTKRGAHPALTATLRNRAGDANIASVVTAFPPSEFLENAHIRTVCTRADFAASNCPAGAIYGTATVYTPLLDEPLTGNVYLRSSNNLLPDLVPDLRGPASLPVRIEAAGRTDSVNGGIRNSFDQIPDAPFSKLVLQLQGGRKGLLVNSRDICAHTYRATVRMTAHNGRRATLRPALQAQCGKKGKRGKAKRSSHRRAGRVG